MAKPEGSLLVTGANGGLGAAIVETLQSNPPYNGHYGLYTVRDAGSASTLKATLDHVPSQPYDLVDLDLTDLSSVRRVASSINKRVASGEVPPIKLLVLNAGFQDFGCQVFTKDGFDQTFAANYLGHWLLTLLLLQSIDKASGRIVVIGSQSHDPKDPRNDRTRAFLGENQTFLKSPESIDPIARGTWSSAKEDPSWRGGYRRYGASKLFSIMMIYELQRRLDADPALSQVGVSGVDPGTMGTGMQRHAPWVIRVVMFKIIYPIVTWLSPDGQVRSPQTSAAQVVQAATRLDAEGKVPKYAYYFNGEDLETSAEANDAQKRDWVWKKSIQYAHLTEGETVLQDWK